jgi:hypothetical protein
VIDFDGSTGRLRLEQPFFGALVDHLDPSGPTADETALRELRAAGVLIGDDPDPRLLPALQAILGAAVQVRMTVADSSHAVFHQGWAGGPTTALLLQTRGSLHELLTLPTLMLPAFVASTSRMGPRKVRAEDAFDLGAEVMDDLLSLGDEDRRTAIVSLREVAPRLLADAVAADEFWTWGVESAWKNPEGRLAGTWLHVLESSAGTWVRGEEGFEPSSGTEIWRALVTLMPDDHELADDVREGLAAAQR